MSNIYFGEQKNKSLADLRKSDRSRWVAPGAIPNMAGHVLTVRGPLSPDQLGMTLMHEHLFVDLRKTHLPHAINVELEGRTEPILTTEDFPATQLAVYEAKVQLGNLHIARDMGPIADNYVLADEDVAAKEILEFKNLGGSTVVEVTSIGLKRAPESMRRVSERTGLNIVMGTGYYHSVYHPEDMDDRTVEELTNEIVADIVTGVGDTGIRSGIIGEVGVNGDPLGPNETKSIKAAARASRLTGAAISFHRGGTGRERLETLNILGEEGANLDRVVLGHSDEIAEDPDLMIELLERGVYLQFDLLGRATTLTESPTSLAAKAIPELLGAGFENRLLLSHDVCLKVHLQHYGGAGYSFIPEKFLPHLRENGVTRLQTEKMMVENPARILPFDPPSQK